MKACEALIAWTPADPVPGFPPDPMAGKVRVGLRANKGQRCWADAYEMTGGADFPEVRALRGDASKARLFIDFHTLVVRDGIDPKAAHEAFLVIDEYRTSISHDISGAMYFDKDEGREMKCDPHAV